MEKIMKKITVGVALALTMSANAFAAGTISEAQRVSTDVAFGKSATFVASITPITGLPAGETADKTVIATVSVTGAGGSWALGSDPNDSSAGAPDKGWTMKSKTDSTKTVRVAVDNDGRLTYVTLGNVVWNIYPATKSASIITYGKQTIQAGDDYDLGVNVAKYVP